MHIECLFGAVWNHTRLPTCVPVYCGATPQPNNALVAVDSAGVSSFTGAQRGDTVTYECEATVLSPPPAADLVVTCLDTGQWSTEPVCTRELYSDYFCFKELCRVLFIQMKLELKIYNLGCC